MPAEFTGCFPEGRGFVLVDAARLDEMVPDAPGRDLMALFGESELGDRVAAEGVAVPILNCSPGYYTVRVGPSAVQPTGPAPALRSDGWVLGTRPAFTADLAQDFALQR